MTVPQAEEAAISGPPWTGLNETIYRSHIRRYVHETGDRSVEVIYDFWKIVGPPVMDFDGWLRRVDLLRRDYELAAAKIIDAAAEHVLRNIEAAGAYLED